MSEPAQLDGDQLLEHFEALPDDELRDLLEYRPVDRDELWGWIRALLGVEIPRVSVCEHHCAPFDFMADLYFGEVRDALILGPRKGGKTLGMAVLEFAEGLHFPGIKLLNIGATKDQAKRCFKHMTPWLAKARGLDLVDRYLLSEILFVCGSTVEIVAGTYDGVNGVHPNRMTVDEVELMDWLVLQEAMPTTTTTEVVVRGVDGKPLRRTDGSIDRRTYQAAARFISTRKFAGGNMEKLLKEKDQRGLRVYEYCALEVTQRCTEEDKPSCEPCKEVIKYDAQNEQISWYDVCRERLRGAAGFIPVDDLINKFRLMDVEKFKVQVAPCDEPSRGDTAFTEFRKELHLRDLIEYRPDLPLGTAWDFGVSDPNVCIVLQWDGADRVYAIDEICTGEIASSPAMRRWQFDDVGNEVLDRYGDEELAEERRAHWCDPAGSQRGTYTALDTSSAVRELKRMGIRVYHRKRSNPARCILAIKWKLRRDPDLGEPTLIVCRQKCPRLAAALEKAQWKQGREDIVHDEHSHTIKALGYWMDGRYPVGGRRRREGEDDDQEEPADAGRQDDHAGEGRRHRRRRKGRRHGRG